MRKETKGTKLIFFRVNNKTLFFLKSFGLEILIVLYDLYRENKTGGHSLSSSLWMHVVGIILGAFLGHLAVAWLSGEI